MFFVITFGLVLKQKWKLIKWHYFKNLSKHDSYYIASHSFSSDSFPHFGSSAPSLLVRVVATKELFLWQTLQKHAN